MPTLSTETAVRRRRRHEGIVEQAQLPVELNKKGQKDDCAVVAQSNWMCAVFFQAVMLAGLQPQQRCNFK